MNQTAPLWPWWRIALWGTVFLLVCRWQGPGLLRDLRPPSTKAVDFFQEWASAKFFFAGEPVYAPQDEAAHRYLGWQPDADGVFNKLNAHPPSSVLLALPFAALDYSDACLTWNLLSLAAFVLSIWLVVRHLAIPFSPWTFLPLFVVLVFCNPLRKQIVYAQLNLFLLALIVGAWVASRSSRPALAGALVGTAAALKLFPAFLFLYFLLRRQGRALLGGAVALAVWTAVTAAVLGFDAYRDYVQEVLPTLTKHRGSWLNVSLWGFWYKLFVDGRGHGGTVPLWQSPFTAQVGTAACCLVVVAVLAWIILRARDAGQQDQAFGLTVTAMLLVSPITWEHYFLLLLLPVALLWAAPRPAWFARIAFWFCLVVLWLPPSFYWLVVFRGRLPAWPQRVAEPWQTLTALSLQAYALLGLFILGALLARKRAGDPSSRLAATADADLDRRLFGSGPPS